MTGAKLPGAAALDKVAKSQTLDKISARVKQMFTSNNQKASDKLFARLKVGTTSSALFESAAYQTWANSVSKAYKKNPGSGEAAMLQTMISHYGNEALAKLLSEAQQVSKTMRVAEVFEKMQLDNWLATGRTADDVYGLLKLNVDMEGILRNPLLKTWITYVDKLGKEDPYSLLLSKLVKHYGEYGLSNVLLRAKTDDRTFQVTESVQKALLSKWQNDGKTADDVFKLLKLNTDKGDELLENPALSTWMSYVTLEKGDPYNLLLLKLKSRYDEEELAHMLVVTESVIARDVAMALLKSWLSKGKTAEDVFKLLRLNSEKGYDILTNPTLSTWSSYLRMRNQNPEEILFMELKTRFSDEALAKMLVAAASDVRVQINVHVPALVMMQLKSGLKEGRAADDVFSLLKLNDKLFDTSMLSTWRSYLQMLDKKNADELMISVIRKYYDDEILEKMIVQAKKNPSTSTVASNLEGEMWRSQGKSPDDVLSK